MTESKNNHCVWVNLQASKAGLVEDMIRELEHCEMSSSQTSELLSEMADIQTMYSSLEHKISRLYEYCPGTHEDEEEQW